MTGVSSRTAPLDWFTYLFKRRFFNKTIKLELES